MRNILIEKLQWYIVKNNPDLFFNLPDRYSVIQLVTDKVDGVMPFMEALFEAETPPYIIEEQCMNELTADLRPSKFSYIRDILEEDFLQTYSRYQEMGVLTYEIMNMIEACNPVFEKLGFTEENEDDRMLLYAIIGTIAEYLEK